MAQADATYPERFESIDDLETFMTRPTDRLVDMMRTLDGDIMILGVGGKIGPTMIRAALRAIEHAGVDKRVIGVTRTFRDGLKERLEAAGVQAIAADLLDKNAVAHLPDVKNIIYLAGRKFGVVGTEATTWAINAVAPAYVAERFHDCRIVVFSTGCVYPLVPVHSGGSREDSELCPLGEYANSAVARERVFEYFAGKNHAEILQFRLFYSIDMRYGVLFEIGKKVFNDQPVDVTMGHVNVIWQGDVIERALLSLKEARFPPVPLNVTGEDTLAVRDIAHQFATLFGKTVTITGTESDTALLGNVEKSLALWGAPAVSPDHMIRWLADWISERRETWNKPTHFEVRDGQFLD